MNSRHDVHSAESAAGGETAVVARSALNGLALSIDGYVLSPIDAPTVVGELGELTFQIQDPSGEPVTAYTTAHDQDLHLIIARSDGSWFRHVHPALDPATGTWSLPWQWVAGGSYRVFADFVTAGAGESALTLARSVHVAGAFTPVAAQPSRTDEVAGFTVSLDGELVAGSPRALTITITRAGESVTTLEPYLSAFGHLVALRDGDLAFLHVHPEGDEPKAGETSGPTITFSAEAPTAGRYLLYLDFQVGGAVHTAQFVLDAARNA